MQRVNYQDSLYPLHENRRIGIRVRKINLKITRKVGNLERTKDGTNNMRDMYKRPNLC